MLTTAQIDAGAARLDTDKLRAEDIDKTVDVMKMFFQDLASDYDWATKLAGLDDAADTARKAAQVAACIIILEELGFGVAIMNGGRDAINFKEKDEYWQYVEIIHFKCGYTLPAVFTTYSLARKASTRTSSTVYSDRVEPLSFGIGSERSSRRRYRRI